MNIHGVKILAAALAGLVIAAPAYSVERTVDVAGFGAKSGAIRLFGMNAEAALNAAADAINAAGGVKLGDGATGKIKVTYYDDRCNAEEGISVVRRIAATDAIIGVGPSCSNVAESAFGILQKKVGDASDSGLQFPIFADVASKVGLAGISEWSFRNVPNELEMYKSLFGWVKQQYPDLKTLYGGVEVDFAHSKATFGAMKGQAEANGFNVLGTSEWLLNDTAFSNQVRDMRRAQPDIVAISAHPITTCGVLREMERQQVKPKLLIGLTSSSTLETLKGCAKQAQGLLIPTGFAPINNQARTAAEQIAAKGGSADLHSAASYEIMFYLKDIIESQGVMAKPETVEEDRRKMRAGMAALDETRGLLGAVKRTADREAIKPFVFVQARGDHWEMVHNPAVAK
ncbi:MAG: ABC transporter substrate-binding protein [Castellaniella sp.]|uniref:ABC transporter substrate-binding protein n=1 Tax=Castellaniella sp. TaxID=1955812 RepID=UPI003C79368F